MTEIPISIIALFQDIERWESCGERRARGRYRTDPRYEWLYVAWDPPGPDQLFMTTSVAPDMIRIYGRADAEKHIWHRIESKLRDAHLPGCVVPGCTDKGRTQFHAAAPGRLAGRDWQPGDAINLCPPHAQDIYVAVYRFEPVHLAEWIRADLPQHAHLDNTTVLPIREVPLP